MRVESAGRSESSATLRTITSGHQRPHAAQVSGTARVRRLRGAFDPLSLFELVGERTNLTITRLHQHVASVVVEMNAMRSVTKMRNVVRGGIMGTVSCPAELRAGGLSRKSRQRGSFTRRLFPLRAPR